MTRVTEQDVAQADELDELVAEFLVEAGDGADQLERDLVALERDPTSRELQNGIFRTVHTLKGTSSLLGFDRVAGLAHVTEALLVGLREGRVLAGTDLVDVLLQFVDLVRRLLAGIEADGSDAGVDVTDLVGRAQALAEAGIEAPVAVHEERPLGTVLVESGLATATPWARPWPASSTGDPRPLGEILVANGAVTREALERVLGQQKRRAADRTVRVDPDLLDRLLGLVDDLAAARDLLLRNLPPSPRRSCGAARCGSTWPPASSPTASPRRGCSRSTRSGRRCRGWCATSPRSAASASSCRPTAAQRRSTVRCSTPSATR